MLQLQFIMQGYYVNIVTKKYKRHSYVCKLQFNTLFQEGFRATRNNCTVEIQYKNFKKELQCIEVEQNAS